jgi:GNAT superfamily N-acetyltransferase
MKTIEFREDRPDRGRYLALFETTGWNEAYRADGDELAEAVGKSWYAVAAYEEDDLVGFGRIVSDGVLYAMIYDMIVRPSHQGRGIGTAILDRLVARCRKAGVREIQLFSARGKADFYRRRGFMERQLDGPGMRMAGRRKEA